MHDGVGTGVVLVTGDWMVQIFMSVVPLSVKHRRGQTTVRHPGVTHTNIVPKELCCLEFKIKQNRFLCEMRTVEQAH